ncbi:MAG: DsbA family protein [Gammaproteobacteria bacterium]
MRLIKTLIISFMLLTTASFATTPNKSFNSDQTKQIQQIVHDYLLKNPQLLVQVANELQQQEQVAMEKKALEGVKANAKALFNSNSPFAGNPKGKVVLIEFFDYQCAHCKKMVNTVSKLIKQDPNLKVIYKDFPIFPNSDLLAKAALAAKSQNKYIPLHEALMNANDPVSEQQLMQIAKKVGIDTNKLNRDMKESSIDQQIDENMNLAQNLGFNATPMFVLVSNVNLKNPAKMKVLVIPGEVPFSEMQKMIKQNS